MSVIQHIEDPPDIIIVIEPPEVIIIEIGVEEVVLPQVHGLHVHLRVHHHRVLQVLEVLVGLEVLQDPGLGDQGDGVLDDGVVVVDLVQVLVGLELDGEFGEFVGGELGDERGELDLLDGGEGGGMGGVGGGVGGFEEVGVEKGDLG